MERELARSGRGVVARATIAGVLMLSALPSAAGADKPADNPGQGPKADPPGQAVRAHGAPSHSGPGRPSDPRQPGAAGRARNNRLRP